MSTTLTVTTKGQVTLRKEILGHLGVGPGEKVEINLLPGGRVQIKARQQSKSISQLRGFLRDKTDGTRLSLEELNDAITNAGSKAGQGSE